jgi:Zn-dependent peptidase ImmA (M78 family)
LSLPNDVSGITVSDGRVGLFIVTNGEHGRQRQRFSLAHEYGHVLMDRERALMSAGKVVVTDASKAILEANTFKMTFASFADVI